MKSLEVSRVHYPIFKGLLWPSGKLSPRTKQMTWAGRNHEGEPFCCCGFFYVLVLVLIVTRSFGSNLCLFLSLFSNGDRTLGMRRRLCTRYWSQQYGFGQVYVQNVWICLLLVSFYSYLKYLFFFK